jgi:phospholipid-binding lipoprotein MlaA
MKAKAKVLSLALSAALLAGCAQVPPDAGQNPEDPWETFNRNMWAFNQGLDVVVKPVTEGYRFIVPKPAREGVSNFFDNLLEPGNAVNNLLQGKVSGTLTSVFRFLLNSTIGVAGIFDVATWVGMERQPEDFGQTLGVWGVGPGPYLVLPVLGPSSPRDIWRWPVQAALNPMTYILWDEEWYWETGYLVVDGLDTRSRMMDDGLDDMLENTLDSYTAVRTAYRQMRRNQVSDGQQTGEEQLKELTPLDFGDDEEAPKETDKNDAEKNDS